MIRKTLGLTLLMSVFLLALSPSVFAASDEEDKTGFIMHHVKDSHEWHFATFGHSRVTIALHGIIFSSDRGLELFMSYSVQCPMTLECYVEHEGQDRRVHHEIQAVNVSTRL